MTKLPLRLSKVSRGAAYAAIGGAMLVGATLLVQDVPSAFQLHSLTNGAAAKGHLAAARLANFGAFTPSPDARQVADWIADSRDNSDLDFLVVDKKYATLYVFDRNAQLRGTSPVLLGSAIGDDSVPGIGERPLAEVRPEERTTPAGRFMAERGRNARGEDVVWVDYDVAVSMHRVISTNPKEQRLERLASTSVADNRISWGCINVPVAFYENAVRPTFATHRALIYVLPDVKTVQQVFGAYDVVAKHRLRRAVADNVAAI